MTDLGWDDDAGEVSLVGGRSTGAVRKGDTVRRAVGPWTPTVHALLRWLHGHGFDGCPQVRGIDAEGREVLTFIEGQTLSVAQSDTEPVVVQPWPDGWHEDEWLVVLGRMIRRFHDAAAGFVPDDPTWRLSDRRLMPGDIVCHGDLGPWNVVCR